MVTAGCKLAVQPEFVLQHRLHGKSIMTAKVAECFDLGDFIDFNLVRRWRGEEEMTIEQYNACLASPPLLTRLSNKKKRLCHIAFRRATMHYSGATGCISRAIWPWLWDSSHWRQPDGF